MATVIVKLKLMMESPETDIEKIQEKVEEKMSGENVKTPRFEIQPIAFGLKALIILFGWPEEKELEKFENSLSGIEGVKSVEVVDMRRAVE